MKQEDKDKLLEKLNQMLERADKAISILVRLMENDTYPKEDCLEQIDTSNKQKEAILKMIENMEQKDKKIIDY